MSSGGPQLSIDLSSPTAIAATIGRSGARIPVLVGGRHLLPTGIAIDPTGHRYYGIDPTAAQSLPTGYRFVADPVTLLTTPPPPTESGPVDGVDVLAGLLRHLTDHAAHQVGAPITALTLTIPTGWGPRRRGLLTDAATRAALPPPVLVTAPAALAAYATTLGMHAPPGSCLLTCHTDQRPATLTVLQAHPDGYTELATQPVGQPHDLDQILTHHVITTATSDDDPLRDALHHPDTDTAALHDAVRQARHTLATHDRAPILLPAPRPPAVITRADVTTAAQPLLDRIPTAVTNILDAADVDRTHLTAVIVRHTGPVPGLIDTLTTATATTTGAVDQPHALADGALTLTTRHHHTATAATTQLPRIRLRITDLITAVLLGGCSLALLLHAVHNADIYKLEGRIIDVVVSMPQLGAAGALAALAAYAVAHLAPTTWLAGPPTTAEPTTGRLIRHAYLTAAIAGPITAALYGLAVGTALQYPYRPFLTWTLGWALPLAACATIIAAAAPRIPADDLPHWLTRTKPVITHATIAATGILLMTTALMSMPMNSTGIGLIRNGGAALIGIATALTLTRIRTIRIITATGLAIGYALVVTWPTHGALITGYLIALTWWTIHLTAHTLKLAFPLHRTTLHRLIGNQRHGGDRPPPQK
ncbi:hypothetical protein AB0875_27400 [Micromonospora gifhornensis]|uniref:hypothetical protein n=1 Tax=Micromonospora gifhornensis TaxID=84594 RepID=UPI003452F275